MKITRDETSDQEVVLNIELESPDLEPYLDKAIKRVATRVQIPGFRPGKAPRAIVESHVGRETLIRENLESILKDSLSEAVKQEELEPFGEPDLELVEISPLSFKATVPLEPLVDLGDYRDIRLTPEPVEVTQEQVEQVVERLRYDAAPWQPAETAIRFGDLVNLDVDGFIEGKKVTDDKGVDYVPAQDNQFPLPGFSVYLEGINSGEVKEFTLTVPEDYGDKAVAGKECRFKVTVHAIKEKILPDLDDEFAKGVGQGHESLEALRASVMEDLTARAEGSAQRDFQEKSLDQVVQGAKVEVSELTTTREIDHLVEDQARALQDRRMDMDSYLKTVGKSQEEMREELKPRATERLTRYLVLRKLAQEEGIEVSPEEIDTEIDNFSSGSSQSQDSVREAFSSENARSSLGNAILARKVLDRLGQIAQGQEKDSTVQSVEELTPTEEGQDTEEAQAIKGTKEPAP